MQPIQSNRWRVAAHLSVEADQALLSYPAYLRQILYNRGIFDADSACRFLDCQPPAETDPYLLKDMQIAVDRLVQALQLGEQIAVYGDYDADGVTATALLVEVLRALGGNVSEYIPNRFDEGYGLNVEALDTLHNAGIPLVITVDCGIRSLKEAFHARSIGIDLIITDHHHPIDEIPLATAVINPKQPGDAYPDKDLAGVGVAYKLAQALVRAYPAANLAVEDWLDLVAIGTVTDLAPLVGENRALVRTGLNKIRTGRRQGLVSLAGAAGMNLSKTSASDIGFVLGPRLNAAGRLDSALLAYHLLTARSMDETGLLAQQLDDQNRERQKKTREVQVQVETMLLDDHYDAPLIFAVDAQFNPGVVGLAASRLTDQYYRPSIVACRMEEYTRASCRSIPGFHITDALDQCADLLERHGGHAAAAGFTVRNDRLEELISRLQAIAREQLGDKAVERVLDADLEISFHDLNDGMFPVLERIQPTGYGNREPVFVSRNLKVVMARVIGKESQHLKLKLMDKSYCTFNAIAFRQGHRYATLPQVVDLMYTFEPNEYNGRVEPQLNVRDIKAAGTPD